MKVLVSGAGGFLGRHVVHRLLGRGHSVRAMVRPASELPNWPDTVELFPADLRVHDKLEAAFEGIDSVVHAAAGTSGNEDSQFSASVVATERFLDAMARSSVRRLIHISSLVVYDWGRTKGTMDEQTPLARDIYDMGAYTVAKVWQERVVSRMANANGWELTILRPGFIWGQGHAEIAGMGRHIGRAYVMFGPLTRLPLSHILNCADCVVAATENAAAVNQTFNVIDDDDIRVWRYVREYAKRTGQTGLPIPLPYWGGYGLAVLAALSSRLMFGEKGKLPSLLMPRRFEAQFKPIRFSNRKLVERLGWLPPLTFEECLRSTYEPA